MHLPVTLTATEIYSQMTTSKRESIPFPRTRSLFRFPMDGLTLHKINVYKNNRLNHTGSMQAQNFRTDGSVATVVFGLAPIAIGLLASLFWHPISSGKWFENYFPFIFGLSLTYIPNSIAICNLIKRDDKGTTNKAVWLIALLFGHLFAAAVYFGVHHEGRDKSISGIDKEPC